MAANASNPAPQANQFSRPRMPHRTLSSSLRLYSSPLLPRAAYRSKNAPQNGALSPTHEVNESDPLLGFSSYRNSSIATGSVATGYGVDDDEDEVDIEEAEQSDEQADSDGLYPPNCCWTTDGTRPPKRSDPFGNRECNVYGNIHRVRREIISSIDDPYSLEQLKAPRMNISVVRPLVDKFYSMQDLSIVYCLLVNRAQFIREQSYAAHHQTVNLTRALLCELLAEKVLRRYNEFNPGPRGLLKIANILVAGFEPFQGASETIINDSSHATYRAKSIAAGWHHHKLTALEVAIVSESKSFLASTACQKVVDAIYRGKIVYSPTSYIDIIPDRWKRRPISLYDPRRAPVLNQYRLVVPRTRNVIEVIQFIVLLILYILVMTGRETRQTTKYEVIEIVFEVYAFGWILDQFASVLEHGWQVYTQNLWSFLDVMFSLLFLIYFGLRMRGLNYADPAASDAYAIAALDVLSCAAPVLIPRLAFNVMSENMLFLSLRAMMGDFITLTALAIWCFAGFLLSLKWLHNGLHESVTISKWMIFVWFGLDGTGIDQAPRFHPYLGPALMITFAFLGNTLFLTILVSMLSNTFSLISGNAVQEIQYRRAVLTFMGVKSDSLFAFMPPFNLAAIVVFGPLKWILTPRAFHSTNVFIVRILNLPTLVLLSWYERNTLWVSNQYRHIRPKRIDWKHHGGPRVVAADWWSHTLAMWDFTKFSAHGDIQAVFDTTPPEYDTIEDNNNENENEDVDENDNNDQVIAEEDDLHNLGPMSPLLGKRLRDGVHAQFRSPFARSPRKTSIASSHEHDSSRPMTPKRPLSRNQTTTKSPLATTNNNDTTVPMTTATTDTTRTTSPALTRSQSLSRAQTLLQSQSLPPTPSQPKPTFIIPEPKTAKKSHRSRRSRRPSSLQDLALRKEFHDSEEEAETVRIRRKSRAMSTLKSKHSKNSHGAHSGDTAGHHHHRLTRKDSLIDYEDGNIGAMEANARLLGLERRLARMEALLVRVVDAAEAGVENEFETGPDEFGHHHGQHHDHHDHRPHEGDNIATAATLLQRHQDEDNEVVPGARLDGGLRAEAIEAGGNDSEDGAGSVSGDSSGSSSSSSSTTSNGGTSGYGSDAEGDVEEEVRTDIQRETAT